MNSISVLNPSDQQWPYYISKAHSYDFYHTSEYSSLVKGHTPILFVSSFGNDFIAIPLIIREIEFFELYDCTSVYGYCGPISNIPVEEISEGQISFFQKELTSFFIEKRITSVFSRLHPFINSEKLLHGIGEIEFVNRTVGIDLTLPNEVQLGNYRKNHMRNIKKLKRMGVKVFETSADQDISSFFEIYKDAMKRLKAEESYSFNIEYFKSFITSSGLNAKLLLAKLNGSILGGAIFVFTNGIVQYHLGADAIDFRDLSSMKLLIDEARIMGGKMGMKFLHLGGSFDGNSHDSLYHFKSGFSNERFDFKVWKYIVDHDKYNMLVRAVKSSKEGTNKFFPAYRQFRS